MKRHFPVLLMTVALAAPLLAAESKSTRANTLILDDTGVKNLRIQTEVVEPADMEETVFALGRIEVYPGNRSAISSRISGRALEVLIKLDHPVQKGDPAVVIESRQVGDPPPSVTVYAPISGLVSATHVVPGEPVNPDKTLAEIVDLTTVYALARVPEHLAGQLKAGQTAYITITATSGKTYPATLEHLGVMADPASGTVEAAFHVENPSLALRPGMRAEFSIVVSKRTDITRVPRSALQGTPSDRYVYVKDFDLPNAFVKTPVVTGQSNERYVEIISGLLPADEVVTQGAYSLAFAGGGTVSLKAALDAAHGHEHNEDGSEITAASKKAAASPAVTPAPSAALGVKDSQAHGHDDGHDHDDHDGSGIWKILSGVFFLAFLTVLFTKKPAAPRAQS